MPKNLCKVSLHPGDTVGGTYVATPLTHEIKCASARSSHVCLLPYPLLPLHSMLRVASRQAGRQAGRQVGRQAGRQADRYKTPVLCLRRIVAPPPPACLWGNWAQAVHPRVAAQGCNTCEFLRELWQAHTMNCVSQEGHPCWKARH